MSIEWKRWTAIAGNCTTRAPILLNQSHYQLPSYILRTASGRTDGRDVYGVTERPSMTSILPKVSNYSGDSRRHTVPTSGPEGGVGRL